MSTQQITYKLDPRW